MTPRISNNLTIILPHSQGHASIVEGEGYPNVTTMFQKYGLSILLLGPSTGLGEAGNNTFISQVGYLFKPIH